MRLRRALERVKKKEGEGERGRGDGTGDFERVASERSQLRRAPCEARYRERVKAATDRAKTIPLTLSKQILMSQLKTL